MADSSNDSAFFHESSGTVRFWVTVDGKSTGASVSREALRHRFGPGGHGDDPVETYRAHAAEITAAVLRRIAQGSIEPVMLREYDLRPQGPG